MLIRSVISNRNRLWPWLVLLVILAATVAQLRYQGRLWTCACGSLWPWAGNVKSAHNSQHLADPYSFTHLLHGLVFCGLLAWTFPRLPLVWRFVSALAIESAWEVIENTEFVIQRYREATLALGYQGDTILNSMGDILFCSVGFVLARYLGFRRSVVLFFVIDVTLLIVIRDSLVLNIVMLIWPVDVIKAWQMGQ